MRFEALCDTQHGGKIKAPCIISCIYRGKYLASIKHFLPKITGCFTIKAFSSPYNKQSSLKAVYWQQCRHAGKHLPILTVLFKVSTNLTNKTNLNASSLIEGGECIHRFEFEKGNRPILVKFGPPTGDLLTILQCKCLLRWSSVTFPSCLLCYYQ